jgi:hypothetical protein
MRVVIKNTLSGINSRLDITEEKISDFEGISLGITQNEIQTSN